MAKCKPYIVRVAVPSPLRRLFDNLVPDTVLQENADHRADVGCRVAVTFGRREVIGLIIEKATTSDFDIGKLKPINRLLDSAPLVPDPLFELFGWAANYYQYPMGGIPSSRRTLLHA